VNDDTGQLVVKIIDRTTKEVIRQMPSEEMLAIAKTLDSIKGLFVKQIGLTMTRPPSRSGGERSAGLRVAGEEYHGGFVTGPRLEPRCKQHRQPVDGGREGDR
jgi:hypothetical protein